MRAEIRPISDAPALRQSQEELGVTEARSPRDCVPFHRTRMCMLNHEAFNLPTHRDAESAGSQAAKPKRAHKMSSFAGEGSAPRRSPLDHLNVKETGRSIRQKPPFPSSLRRQGPSDFSRFVTHCRPTRSIIRLPRAKASSVKTPPFSRQQTENTKPAPTRNFVLTKSVRITLAPASLPPWTWKVAAPGGPKCP